MKKQQHLHIKETGETKGVCNGIHELIDFEVIQYRREVDVHRHDLSKVEGRCVAWQEAEKDFNATDRLVLEGKWRTEYCGHICHLRENCLTAAHFLQSKHDRLSRAG